MTSGPEPGPAADTPRGAKVFVSYSRRDRPFADRVDAALRAHGFDPLIDRADIYAFEDWWRRIEALIGQADTMVFIVSPNSIASGVCKREIECAASLNKRLAPIVCQPVNDALLPPELARLNFIFFDDEERFEEGVARLVEALGTDIDWVRRHTEFGEQVRHWDAAGRPRGLLLRSPALEEAERWIASRPRGAPLPTALTQTYIQDSRHAATRSRNLLVGSLSVGLVVALVLSVAAVWFGIESRNQRNVAEERNLSLTAAAARRQIDSGDSLSALATLRDALQRHGPGELPPEVAVAAHLALWTNREVGRQRLGQAIERAWWSKDGRNILALSGGKVHVFDADLTAQRIVEPDGAEGLANHPGALPFRMDGAAVVIRLAKPGAAELRWQPESKFPSPFAVVANGRCSLTVFGRTDAGELSYTVADSEDIRRGLCGSNPVPENVQVTYTSADRRRQVRVGQIYNAADLVDLASGQSVATVAPYIRGSLCVGQGDDFAFSPDSRTLIYANCFDITETHQPTLIDTDKGTVVAVLGGHEGDTGVVAFNGDGTRLLTGTNKGELRLWSTAPNAYVAPGDLAIGRGDVTTDAESLTFAVRPSGRAVVVDRRDGRTLLAFDARSGGLWPTTAPEGDFRSWPVDFAVSADRRYAILRIGAGPVQLWSLASGRLVKSVPGADTRAGQPFVMAAKAAAFLGADGARVQIFRFADGRETIHALPGETWKDWALDTSGEVLAVRTQRQVVLWRVGRAEPTYSAPAKANEYSGGGDLLRNFEGGRAVLLATTTRGLIVDVETGVPVAESFVRSVDTSVVGSDGKPRLLAKREGVPGLLDPRDWSFAPFPSPVVPQLAGPFDQLFLSGEEIVLGTGIGKEARLRAIHLASGAERVLLAGYKSLELGSTGALLVAGTDLWRLVRQPFSLKRLAKMERPVVEAAIDARGETGVLLLDDGRIAVVSLVSGAVLGVAAEKGALPEGEDPSDAATFVAEIGGDLVGCLVSQCFALHRADGRLALLAPIRPSHGCIEWRVDQGRGLFHCARGTAALPGYYGIDDGKLVFVPTTTGPPADLVKDSFMTLTLAGAPGCRIGVVNLEGGNADLPFSGLTDLWDFQLRRSLLKLNGSVLTTTLGAREAPGHGLLPELAIRSEGDPLSDGSQSQSMVALLGRAPPLRVLRAPAFCNHDSLRRELDARVTTALHVAGQPPR
jgi:WD40 repeat protein